MTDTPITADMSRFHVDGPADALAIVFVHASGWTWKMWQPQLDALADEFRVVAFDLPGHGRLAHMPFRMDAAVDELAAAVREETTIPPLVVGLSLGGFVAMAFAARHPAAASGLVLAGCSVRFGTRLRFLTRATACVIALFHFALRRRWLDWLARRQERAVRGELPPALAAAQIGAGFYFRDYGRALLEMVARAYGPALRAFCGPILILNGERDVYNLAGTAALAACGPDTRSQIIARASHICNLDRPDEFTRAVRGFAREVARRRGALRSTHKRPPLSS
jgi:pimeloyl-ACP methyl ester carboxylesterase